MAVGERAKDSSSDENLVRRIRSGDRNAEKELVDTYYRGILVILRQRTRDLARAEDLAQETIMTVITRLRTESIDHPQFLRRYIQQTAKYLFIGWTRKAANSLDHIEYADDVSPESPGLDETVAISRTRMAVRRLINELRTERDREILQRYYVLDEAKVDICDAMGLTPTHFDRVISRARSRFKELIEDAEEL